MILALAAAAQAQDDPVGDVQDQAEQVEQVRQAEATAQDPGPGCVELTQPVVGGEGATGCDTEYTPIAKDGQKLGWQMVSGQVFVDPETGKPVNSGDYKPAGADGIPGTNDDQTQTDPTADLYTVDFISDFNGLAAGAVCQTPSPDEASFDSHVATCTRVPIVYRFQLDERGVPTWKEVFRGTSPGYVGAITWLTRDSALAVGGTGCYPRREDRDSLEETGHCPDGNPGTDADPLGGEGRAWYSDDVRGDGSFEPRGFGAFPAANVTGMTAADSTYGLSEARLTTECRASRECAFAGGLKQIWMWKDGQFVDDPFEPPDDVRSSNHQNNDPDPVESDGSSRAVDTWLYRVRTLRFRPEPGSGAQAATSGCCVADATGEPDRTKRRPSTMRFFDQTQHWFVALMGAANPLVPLGGNAPINDGAYVANNGKLFPESIYSFAGGSFLFTPGGPEDDIEPGSYIAGSAGPVGGGNIDLAFDEKGANGGLLAGPVLSAARLVAGGEDLLTHQPNFCQTASGDTNYGSPQGANTCGGNRADPDGLIDWAVGELRTTRQALAYTTTQRSYMGPYAEAVPFPLDCPEGGVFGNLQQSRLPLDCQPKGEPSAELRSATLYRLPSYSLNGFTTFTTTGASWAVGDRGAILRLGGEAASATFPPEQRPALGARRTAPAPDREPFEDSQPALTDDPGTVPALAARPTTDAGASPTLIPYGSPDPNQAEWVRAIAMSRDGTEGWAVGPPTGQVGSNRTVLNHFDGQRWTSCRYHRVPGVLDPDPACEALKPLREFNRDGVRITAIARIPLENDIYPTNDDEFEAIAVATPAKEVTGVDSPTILRYSAGKWRIDSEATEATYLGADGQRNLLFADFEITDIAFSGPDDGWMIGDGGQTGPRIFHLGKDGWMPCTQSAGVGNAGQGTDEERILCQDPGEDRDGDPSNGNQGLLPAHDWFNPSELHLAAAGERVYLYGTRGEVPHPNPGGRGAKGTKYPLILYNDPGPCEKENDPGCWKPALDPKHDVGADSDDLAVQGSLRSLSVAQAADGSYTGWATGRFGERTQEAAEQNAVPTKVQDAPTETVILRAEGEEGIVWEPMPLSGPAADYLLPPRITEGALSVPPSEITALPGPDGRGGAVVVPAYTGGLATPPMVRFDPAGERWEVFPTPWLMTRAAGSTLQAYVDVVTADNAGGLWLATRRKVSSPEGTFFYRYNPRVPEPVFTEAPHPIRERITATATGGDGSFWVSTNSPHVYRYDRITGWDRLTVPGWDSGRAVTVFSEANAIAVGPDGEGVLVGRGGRIAEIGPGGAILDRAAGILCAQQETLKPPCGTGRDLRAAAVAPDGSALVGGDYLSLLYRPPGGEFRAIIGPPPPAAAFARITDISMPTPDRAWLTLDTGYVFVGTREGERWNWQVEAVDDFGDTIARTPERVQRLRAVAVDAEGHGYAVGERGVILERKDGKWRLVDSGYLDHLHSVALGPNGDGALIGGENGLVLTGDDGRFAPARPTDWFDPLAVTAGSGTQRMGAATIVGVGVLPGTRPGEVEAWAASQNSWPTTIYRRPEPGGILHYSSDPADPLLDGGMDSTDALPDADPGSPGALRFAALGRTDCQAAGERDACPELFGSRLANEVIAGRIRDEILDQASNRLDFTLFTGDAGGLGGTSRKDFIDAGHEASARHERWSELIVRPLGEAGVPLFGAIGGRDLTRTEACVPLFENVNCAPPAPEPAGPNLAWRQALSGMPAPWGAPDSSEETGSASGLEFTPIETGVAVEIPNQTVEDRTDVVPSVRIPKDDLPRETPLNDASGVDHPLVCNNPNASAACRPCDVSAAVSAGAAACRPPIDSLPGGVSGGQQVGDLTVPTGGARTHYAFDIERDGEELMRVAVVDTSLKSLAASDAIQNPVQEQLTWLEEVLADPARPKRAIVVSNTPTYSYGPGAGTDTQTDAAVFEQVLMENDVDLVVSGRMGWNGVYWALTPGTHYPCPGSPHPDPNSPPKGIPDCGLAGTGTDEPLTTANDTASQIVPGSEDLAPNALPFVIASSAGGTFGPEGHSDGSAAEGYWRGYTTIRIDPHSNAPPIIEQRPVFDWMGMTADTHTLLAGERTKLKSYAREPAGIDVPFRYFSIDSPAITHRYDLLLADQEKPWLPCMASDESCVALHSKLAGPSATEGTDKCAPYLCLPARIGSIDDQTGSVGAGNGKYPDTFAIAMLSVGERAATYPIAFTKSPSFIVQPLTLTPQTPQLPTTDTSAPSPPSPPNPPQPSVPQPNVPEIPAPPPVPPIAAASPPEPQPPAPPAPPPPTEQPSPLNLALAPPAMTIATPTAVIQPPTPPVNPAPPGGARREARQRQAAAQKSGADNEEGSGQTDVDMAGSGDTVPGSNSMTRHDHSFTAIQRADDGTIGPAVLYTGGITLLAAALALGWQGVRPTPRRRAPTVPAPARAWATRQRR